MRIMTETPTSESHAGVRQLYEEQTECIIYFCIVLFIIVTYTFNVITYDTN